MPQVADYRNLYQLGYVTRDLERAIALAQRELGAGEFMVSEPELPVLADGAPARLGMRVAIANVGGIQLEIIEPRSGAIGHYTDDIDFAAADLVFHHVGLAVIGPWANWGRLEADLTAGGRSFKLVHPADPTTEPIAAFGYVDTRRWYGHYTEYLWWSDALADSPIFPDRSRFS